MLPSVSPVVTGQGVTLEVDLPEGRTNSEIASSPAEAPDPESPPPPTLQQLLEQVSSRRFLKTDTQEDRGLAEPLSFPFLAIVGQAEMKLALLLALINPAVGGVLLLGPRGTGKTTAVRSLIDLMPPVRRSLCSYGCLPEDLEEGGLDAVCPDCARKFGEGQPLTRQEPARLVELPLNARLEDVVGGVNERVAAHARISLHRGLLAQADLSLLHVDEVNLLPAEIVDALLDASAQGRYTVRRGPLAATYRARFVLVGSMNPEEGRLRPQIMDRFGLRVLIRGLRDPDERLEAYYRAQSYRFSPRKTIGQYSTDTELAQQEVVTAQRLLSEVSLRPEAAQAGLSLIEHLRIDSLRAELTLFEAARAHAAAAGRSEAGVEDIRAVAAMALRLRRSAFMEDYVRSLGQEEDEIYSRLNSICLGEVSPASSSTG